MCIEVTEQYGYVGNEVGVNIAGAIRVGDAKLDQRLVWISIVLNAPLYVNIVCILAI
jgi:hypothetical protein